MGFWGAVIMITDSMFWFNSYGDLLNGWILPTGGVALGRVCPAACAAGLFIGKQTKIMALEAE